MRADPSSSANRVRMTRHRCNPLSTHSGALFPKGDLINDQSVCELQSLYGTRPVDHSGSP
ncbi:hypothetical protein FOMPIDRAFT_1022189 [Fomitopsis schrenkii]|uniref:Uncharacterized protein n=1 Tax=Fomitopsis schrenkii TaxID=2126942 RepID=S8EJQ3_FOMSC|nr:hypothetical protein FOMPIDRAFT_1022189 [Fomitopsis schrenkii]